MNPNIYMLRTSGGETYFVSKTRRGWELHTHGFCTVIRPTLARILFILGGMVDWNIWTEETQGLLRQLNAGQAI